MSNGTDKDRQQWHQAIQHFLACIKLLQFAPAGLDRAIDRTAYWEIRNREQ